MSCKLTPRGYVRANPRPRFEEFLLRTSVLVSSSYELAQEDCKLYTIAASVCERYRIHRLSDNPVFITLRVTLFETIWVLLVLDK